LTQPQNSAVPSLVPNSNIAATTGKTTAATLDPVSPPVRPAPPRPAEAEVTQVPDDLVVKPAGDLSEPSITPEGRAIIATSPPVVATPGSPKGTNAARKGFLARLNPFGGKPKTPDEPSAAPATTNATSENAATRNTATSVRASTSDSSAAAGLRYVYLSPAKPSPGNRAEADKAFRRGIKAYQSGDRAQAIAEYQAALQMDPAFFNAYYNLGLAALDGGNFHLSLAAYETALVLNSESADARYNFALALKSAGYFRDAADQLTQILAAVPDDARAHLAVANLYSQQLRQPVQAREHYLRVLDLNPRHPEAAKIRFWLTANP
jgi:Flp pilus assembly protein TadD